MEWIFPHFLVDLNSTQGSLWPIESVSAKLKSEAYPLLAQYSQMPHSVIHSTSVCQASAVFEGTCYILRGNEDEEALVFALQELTA